jgi:murein DD-endopeptidase MepM/ murein hydrolase activator NlpD
MNLKAFLLALACVLSAFGITPEDAARIKYSNQSFVFLSVGETHAYRLKDGQERRICLKAVTEHADSVIGLMRRAEVLVEIDGMPLKLVCEPYVMPSEVKGLRIQADTTNRWMDLPKRVQFSLWDASDPIVDTDLFVFPLAGYGLFSQGTQGYNEPVHLGHRDGDPAGQQFYHNYGFDMAGFEGRDEVLACVDATVIGVYPDVGTLILEDDRGIIFEYGHMDRILPEIKVGSEVKRGQKLGLLGRRGGSGNFSHVHVGTYLSKEDLAAGRNCRNLNLYPWLMEAFRKASGQTLFAVARPHHAVRTGETVRFDGTRSLAYGSKIKTFRWEFHDGTSVDRARAEKVYDRPGTYMAALWVEDERGLRDVDFCKVKVYSSDKVEDVMPILFLSYSPSRALRAGQTVYFRGWPQGAEAGPIRLDFGDGTVIENYTPYSEVSHSFQNRGIHIVTGTTTAEGFSVTQKLKVIVGP